MKVLATMYVPEYGTVSVVLEADSPPKKSFRFELDGIRIDDEKTLCGSSFFLTYDSRRQ